jgi:hypothetical protein
MIAIDSPSTVNVPRSLGTIDLLLRDREVMLAKIRAGTNLATILKTMVATIAVTMAIVGAALGSYRGGIQIAYAALKLPLVLLGTAALSAPALTAISRAVGRRSRLAQDLTLVMSALAFASLLLVAGTPLVLLGRAINLSYHDMILMTVGMFGVAGLAALWMIIHAVSIESMRDGSKGWRTAVFGLCVVFTVIGGQLSWALRPYLLRPRAQEVVFVREKEGSLFDAITTAFDSARGVYTREEAPLPEESR